MEKVMAIALVALLLSDAATSSAASSTAQTGSSLEAKNKAVAMRVFDEIFNQGRFRVADAIYGSDFVNHGLHKNFDLAEDQAAVRWEKAVVPDLKITVTRIVAEGDLVSVVWTARGSNTASILGLPVTGLSIEEPGITVWRIVDGKIREEWTSFDEMLIVREIIAQLRWPLFGLLVGLVLLSLMGYRLVRKLRVMRFMRRARSKSSLTM